MMKTKLAFALVLVFSGITSAYTVPVCVQVCPTDAGPGDEVTLTAFDENGEQVDLTEWTGGVETGFWDCDPSGIFQQADEDGTVTFELADCWYNAEGWEFYVFIPSPFQDVELGISGGDYPHANVADAIAAGGTCEGVSCGASPLPNPIIINPNVMTVYEEGETEGDFDVSLVNQPPSGHTITVTVDPNNGGPSEDITLVGGSGPNGSVALTFNNSNWNVPQTVLFNAIDDDIAEPNDQPQLSEEHTIRLVSSYPGHPTDANFVGENTVTATVIENDFPDSEILYNGIELPYPWPPSYGSVPYEPMPVPYLDDPPAVVLIDVGRQLFVDDFLIETTDMTQTYHQADYYSGNPVITSTTAEEVDSEGNKMAGPFSGGSWYDPDDSLYKMWYRGAWDGLTYSQLYATSTDGKNWDRPNLDVNPVVLLDHFTCTPSNPSAGNPVTIKAYNESNQQVNLGNWDLVEFCWEGNLCVDTTSGITIDGSGGAVFTCTQAMLDVMPYFDFLAENGSGPPETEVFTLPFPFDTIARAGNSVYPFSEADALHRDSTSILLDHNAPASQRFKWFATEFEGGSAYMKHRISSDGIHWSAPESSKLIWGDRSTVFYNPFRDVWVCSQRTEDAPSNGRRNRGYTEGTSAADLMSKIQYNQADTATPPSVHWVGADPLDPRHTDPLWDHIEPELYTLDAMPYESVMLGQFSIWQGPYNIDCGTHWIPKRNDILLGFSRDGFHWDRPDRTRFISSTWDDQSWRMGNVQSVVGTPLVVGDELYFYFNARPKPAPDAEDWDKDYQAGLAILRRDGFASMDASGSAKTLTTRPVKFANGKYLFVNTDCPTGELKVEVLDQNSQVIAPFTLANCDTISEDTTLKQVTWGGSNDLSALQGQATRFRFTLDDGSLYAFWVSPDASGASYGYVGGGGPGFTGPRDTVGQQECGGANLDDISDEINTADLAIVAAHWLFDCTAPDWCSGADMDPVVGDRGSVNLVDFANFALYWLETNCN